MIRTVEAVIDERGRVRLLESVQLSSARRALVTILEEEPLEEQPPRGSPQAILQAMREPPHLTREDVEALERAIKEGELPVDDRGIFDEEEEAE